MIAACPTCGARYRIDAAKLRPEGARLRCSRCQSVFRVRAPAADAAPAGPARPAAAPEPTVTPPAPTQQTPPAATEQTPPSAVDPTGSMPSATEPQPPAASPPPGQAAPDVDAGAGAGSAPASEVADAERERLVLVAHAEPEAGKAVADALTSWGLRAMLVHDGVEAILNIQRALPRVVVLDAALPKMFGFQVCELMKRNESLRRIYVILVGAIHDRDRYRRPPGDLYGADAYIEPQQLPDALSTLLERFGLPLGRVVASGPPQPPAPEASFSSPPAVAPVAPPPAEPSVASSTEVPAPATEPAPASETAPVAPSDPALAAEIEQADRLARIIVSDIVLYNPEKFESGLRSGDVVEALRIELEEGRALLAQRVDPRVGSPDDFLRRELLRVARSRGMEE